MGNADFCRWASSCWKKIRFSHATHAKLRIESILHSVNSLDTEQLAVYRCQFCGGFHIGHHRYCEQGNREGRGEL